MHEGDDTERNSGFSLLETLVALVLLSVVISVALDLLRTSLSSVHAGSDIIIASDIAHTKLDEIGAMEPPRSGNFSGRTDSGFDWTATVTPLTATGNALLDPGKRLLWVTVTVSSDRAPSRPLISLVTAKFAGGRP